MSELVGLMQGVFKVPESCNTGTSIHTPHSEPLQSGGDDYLVCGLGVLFDSHFDSVLTNLYRWRSDAELFGECQQVNFRDLVFVVFGGGKKAGVGYYKYRCNYKGISFCLRGDSQPGSGGSDNVRVEIPGLTLLLGGGIVGCWRDVVEFLSVLGGSIQWDKVSRYDMAADLPGFAMSAFVSAFVEGRMVRRVRRGNLWFDGDKVQSLYFGQPKADVLLRLYDKVAETQNDPQKQSLMASLRWGDTVPASAVRVEFQLRRQKLTEYGISSVSDLLEKRGGLARYLCEFWFRITAEVPDPRNPQRAAVAPLWNAVRCAFESWTGSGAIPSRVERPKSKVLPELRFRRVASEVARYLAEVEPTSDVPFTEAMARFVDELLPGFDGATWRTFIDRARTGALLTGHHFKYQPVETLGGSSDEVDLPEDVNLNFFDGFEGFETADECPFSANPGLRVTPRGLRGVYGG